MHIAEENTPKGTQTVGALTIKNTLSAVVCAALMLTTARGRAFAADNSNATAVYGLVIGNEFALPHCTGRYTPSLWMRISEMCWYDLDFALHRQVAKVKNANGEITVVFPKSKFPAMSKSAEIGATVLDKKLVGLVIETNGFKDIKEVFPQLVTKFGEPTTKRVGNLQNGFGANFPSMIATWKRADVTVTYDSHPFPDLDDGHVTIYTPEAAQFRSNGGKISATQGYTPL